MADVTNSGRLDVIVANGHVNDNGPYYYYAMPCRLYQNRSDGRLVDISSQAGAPWEVKRVGRGLAAGDLDNDGRVNAVILPQNEPLAYFHNQTEGAGHFVTFRLEGTKSNRDGVGARLTVKSRGLQQVAQRREAEAINQHTIRGCTSAWGQAIAWTRSRYAGHRARSTAMSSSAQTWATSCAKAFTSRPR